jgi:hypothetical protein
VITPQIWTETSGRLAARRILAGLAEDQEQPIDVRLASLSAIGELEDDLPVGHVLAPIEPSPGTVAQARQLLLDDVDRQPSTRDRLATGRAAARLAPDA